ncbi:MAG: sulfatase, partial [Gemmatimonadaceae bacterium]
IEIWVATAIVSLAPLLLLRPKLHLVAVIVLAVGTGAIASRWSVSRIASMRRLLHGATFAAIIFALGGEGVVRLLERQRGSAPLAHADSDQPNVLLLVLDTVRALSMSAYGYERETTPNLARLAREGVRFDRAVSTAPWTLASHASLFTGRYPSETSVGWTVPLDNTHPVLAEQFAARGMATAGFAANLTYCTPSFGLARGFRFYQDYLVSPGEAIHSSALTRFVDDAWHQWRHEDVLHGRPLASDVADRFLRWSGGNSRLGHPYFAFLNFFDAHAPYSPPAPFDTMFIGREPAIRDPRQAGDHPTAASAKELKAAYDQSLAYLDGQIGRVLDSLRARGELDRTVIVVVSDHGEEFLEKGILEHGDDLYFPSLHVPLLVRYPRRVPAGTVVAEPVSLRDVAATIIDLSQPSSDSQTAASRTDSQIPGTSLTQFWSAASLTKRALSTLTSTVPFAPNLPPNRPISKGGMRSIVGEGLHLIVRGDGHEELYDIMRDPFEQLDLSNDQEKTSALSLLRNSVGVSEPKPPQK